MEDVASSENESSDEAGKPDKGKITLTVSEALESLDRVKNCIEVHGDNEVNMMLNDLIGRVEKLKLKTFLKKLHCKDMIKRTLL